MSKEACRMMISTKGRYALRVMLDMAEHGGGEWHRLSDVAPVSYTHLTLPTILLV